jgi:hypothetical protein
MINHEENLINWDAIIKSHEGVIASDRKRTGTVIAQTEDDIVISDGVVKRHQFIMPKSKVDFYVNSGSYFLKGWGKMVHSDYQIALLLMNSIIYHGCCI